MTTTEQTLLSPEQLAALLGVPLKTIYAWRYRGLGPRALKVGRHVRFRPSDVSQWLDEQADRPRIATGKT
jgi:excisionase family DNA binding protein